MKAFVRRAIALLPLVGLVASIAGAQPRTAAPKIVNPAAAKLENPVPATEDSLANGRRVYQRYCRACHHASGNGKGPYGIARSLRPSDFTDTKWDHGSTDGEIFDVIRNGTGIDLEKQVVRDASGGPSLVHSYEGRVSDTDIWNVVNYLRTFPGRKDE